LIIFYLIYYRGKILIIYYPGYYRGKILIIYYPGYYRGKIFDNLLSTFYRQHSKKLNPDLAGYAGPPNIPKMTELQSDVETLDSRICELDERIGDLEHRLEEGQVSEAKRMDVEAIIKGKNRVVRRLEPAKTYVSAQIGRIESGCEVHVTQENFEKIAGWLDNLNEDLYSLEYCFAALCIC